MKWGRLERLFWWQEAEPISPERCAAQVMVMGGWSDVAEARSRFGNDIFAKVLRNPPRGLFDARSWTFWHKKTGMVPAPPLPEQSTPWPQPRAGDFFPRLRPRRRSGDSEG